MGKFDNIQVGDQVIVHHHWTEDTLETVDKVTKTTFTAGSFTYSKDTGWQRGGDRWTPNRADPATPEEILRVKAEALKRKYVNYLSKYKYDELPIEKLEEIYQIIKK